MKISGLKFEPFSHRPGWFIAQSLPETDLEPTAIEINKTGTLPTHYAVCGFLPEDNQHHLYLIPAGNPLRLIKDFEVGSHNSANWTESYATIIKELSVIHAKNPITPFFADAAGFKVTFQNPITEDLAELIGNNVTEGIDGLENLMDDNGDITEALKSQGYLHLWWD